MTFFARFRSAALAAGVLACLAPLAAALLPAGAAGIEWSRSFAAALERAAAERRVVFVAINMDGERANDRLAEKTYRDKTLAKLSERTVNLVASAAEHDGARCSRFPGLACGDHQAIDVRVRLDVLKSGTAPVIAPQHLFLDPDGELLLSVPYEVRAGELEWCFHEALAAVDPSYAGKRSSEAQRPKRLVVAGFQEAGSELPLAREAALEIIRELRKGGGKRVELLRQLTAADEPEARDEVLQFLRQGPGRGYGGAAGEDRRPTFVRWIGESSPASYWEVLEDYVGGGEVELRREAVIAMEQLAAPEGLPALLAQQRREKDARIEADLLRAIGACGGTDKKARAVLVRAASSKRDELQRRNALVALGWLEADESIDECLAAALASDDELDRAAAAVALGLTRDTRWLESLRAVRDAADTPDVLLAATLAALDVLEGAPYSRLGSSLERVAGDDRPRRRLFGNG